MKGLMYGQVKDLNDSQIVDVASAIKNLSKIKRISKFGTNYQVLTLSLIKYH